MDITRASSWRVLDLEGLRQHWGHIMDSAEV
jgi:hypothetical protein